MRASAIDLRTGTEVSEIDLGATVARTVVGEEHPFDRLLLATGSDPMVPSIPGADGPGVQTMRRIGDSERLAELGRGDSALVAGSGFIGCEAAASLALRGVVVTMATLEAAPQLKRLGEEVAAEISRRMTRIFLRDRRANDAGGMADDERHFFRRAQRGRDDQIALTLAVVIVGNHDKLALGEGMQNFLDRVGHSGLSLNG